MKINFPRSIVVLFLLATLNVYVLASSEFHSHKRLKQLGSSCIKCSFYAGCRTCVAGGTGERCQTPDCSQCIESGSCGGGFDPPPGGGGDSRPSNTSTNVFRLDEKTIKDIGNKHPRFAATLANLNMFGLVPGVQRVHWTPIEIQSDDIDAFLNRESYKDFFSKYNEKARQMNELIIKGEIEEIVYVVTISQGLNCNNLKLDVERSSINYVPESKYSSLEIWVPFVESSENTTVATKLKPSWVLR